MVAVAFADRLLQGEAPIRSRLVLRRRAVIASQRRTLCPLLRRPLPKLAQPRRKRGLEALGICCGKLVFDRENPTRPGREDLRILEPLQLRDQPLSEAMGLLRCERWGFGRFRTG